MTAASLADACDNHWPGDLPAVHPHTVGDDGDGGLCAAYTCPVCRRQWTTGWDPRAAGWPGERAERAA